MHKANISFFALFWSLISYAQDPVVIYSVPVEFSEVTPTFDGTTFSVVNEVDNPRDIAFSPEGTKLVILGKKVHSYTLSVPFDLTTASYDNAPLDIISEEFLPQGLAFGDNGKKMFIIGQSEIEINQYSLSIPYDVSIGVTHDGNPLNVRNEQFSPTDLAFSRDGRKMFVTGYVDNKVNQYSLATPFDITSGVTFDGDPLRLVDNPSIPMGIAFDIEGRKMFIADPGDYITQYNLSTPFDITSGVQMEPNKLYATTEEHFVQDLSFSADRRKMFIVGSSGDEINVYDLRDRYAFQESSLNDGTIEGSMIIELVGDTFVHSNGVIPADALTIDNLPTGLSPRFLVDASGSFGILSFENVAQGVPADVEDLRITFSDDAFASYPAAMVKNAVGANSGFGIDFDLSPSIISDASVQVIESNGLVFDVDAQVNSENKIDQGITFQITGGADQQWFGISESEGLLSFNALTDFESPDDFNLDNTYEVIITANRGGITVDQHFALKVTDKEESLTYSLATDMTRGIPTYVGSSFDLNAQDAIPSGVEFNPDGTKMFVLGGEEAQVYQYSLANPFNVITGVTYDGNPFYYGAEESNAMDMAFSSDGTKMYILGYAGDDINQYSLSVPFDVTSGVVFDGNPFRVLEQVKAAMSLVFNPDGTKVYVLGSFEKEINQYSLSTPFDITTGVSVDGSPYVFTRGASSPQEMYFNANGTKLLIADGNSDGIFQYDVPVPFDITSGVTYDEFFFGVADQEAFITGLTFSTDGTKMYVLGTADKVFQYELNGENAFHEASTNEGEVEGAMIVRITSGEFSHAGGTLPESSFSITNLPQSLSPVFTVDTNGKLAILSLTGSADFHQRDDNVQSLQVTFNDEAFANQSRNDYKNAIAVNTGLGIGYNNRPNFTSPDSANFYENDVHIVLDVNANDGVGGIEDVGITYSLVEDADHSLFEIDANTGFITFKSAPDFENPGDEDRDNIYHLNVVANDGVRTTSTHIQITVIDRFDSPVLRFSVPVDITTSTPTFDGSFRVAAEDTRPFGVAFSSDGLKMFMVGNDKDNVNQYTLANPFDITTGVALEGEPISIAAENQIATGIALNADGTKLYLMDAIRGEVNQYSLSSPFDITSGITFDGSPYSDGLSNFSYSLYISPDGSRFFSASFIEDDIRQFTLEQTFDFTEGATYNSPAFSVTNLDQGPSGVAFSANGTKLVLVGSGGNNVYQFSVPTPFDLSSGVTYDGSPFSVDRQEARPTGITLSPDGTRMFIVGESGDEVNQYTLGDHYAFQETPSNDGFVEGEILLNLVGDQFMFAGDVLPSTLFTVDGLPPGLTPMIRIDASATFGVLTLEGAAVSHRDADDVASLLISFEDGAFVTSSTGAIQNAENADIGFGIDFDLKPSFSSPTTFNVTESNSFIVDIAAQVNTESKEDEEIVYSISGGSDHLPFGIDAENGVLSFLQPPDFENPLDVNGDNTYHVSVSASRGDLAEEQDLVISVLDLFESVNYSVAIDITTDDLDDRPFQEHRHIVFGQEAFANDLELHPDGSKIFLLGTSGRDVNQYNLSTPFDMRGGVSFDGSSFSVGNEEFNPFGFAFNSDGTKMFVVGYTWNTVFQYSLSVPYDVTSGGSYDGVSFSIGNETGAPRDISFSSDGKKMYILSNRLYQYSLDIPFDLSSGVTFDGRPVSFSERFPTGLTFDASGKKLLICGISLGSRVSQYTLNKPFDVLSGFVFDGFAKQAALFDSEIAGVDLSPDGTKLFTHGTGRDAIVQYRLSNGSAFRENPINDGSVLGTVVITLLGDKFVNGGSVLSASSYSVHNLPEGLVPELEVDITGSYASLSLSGKAIRHGDSDDLESLKITLMDEAFVSKDASSLNNSIDAETGLSIDFFSDRNSPFIPRDQRFSYVENQTTDDVLGQINASDNVGVTAFEIISGDLNGFFSIDNSGKLFLSLTGTQSASNDFETLPNNYVLSIVARDADGNESGVQDVVVLLTNMDDEHPVVAMDQTFTYQENQSPNYQIGKVVASDNISVSSYSISSGNDSGHFAIDNLGNLSLTQSGATSNANDFEAIPNAFILGVAAEDDAGNSSPLRDVLITITDLDDEKPVVALNQNFTYNENLPSEQPIGKAIASDNVGITSYSILAGNESGYFAIDNSGNLSLTIAGSTSSANDFEVAPNTYTLSIVAGDLAGNTSIEVDLSITVGDLDDTRPIVTQDQVFTYTENQSEGYSIGSVSASDNIQVTTYSILTGNDAGYFQLDNTGNLTLASTATATAANDFEITPNSFTLGLSVGDAAGNTSLLVDVVISVTDLDEMAESQGATGEETTGDTEIAGDINNDGVIGSGEIAGDINGNGVIDNGEIAGDVNGDGVINRGVGGRVLNIVEIAGDIDGNGIIEEGEIAGDANGDLAIGTGEIAGDTDGSGSIDVGELVGDVDGSGTINDTEIEGDSNGDGTVSGEEETVLSISGSGRIEIYPNPVNDLLTLKISGETISKIQILDFSGRLLKEELVTTFEHKVDVSNLKSGSYLLHIAAGNHYVNWRFVKN